MLFSSVSRTYALHRQSLSLLQVRGHYKEVQVRGHAVHAAQFGMVVVGCTASAYLVVLLFSVAVTATMCSNATLPENKPAQHCAKSAEIVEFVK